MKTRAWIVSSVAVVACVAALALAEGEPAPKPKGLAAMDWLAGAWQGGDGQSTWEANYSTPAGGMIVSASKQLRGGRAVMFDYELFREDKGKVVLTPFPFGKRSVDFPATSIDGAARKAVFANEAHDFPKRFTYQIDEDGKLRITLEGEQGGQPITMKLTFERRK